MPRGGGKCRKTQPPCQKGQKGRKGAPRHDTHPPSGLSDLSDAGAPKKSSELICHRRIARLPIFVVTSLSQTARTKPSSRLRVCSAARRRPSASRRTSGNVFWFARLQRSFRVRKARKVRQVSARTSAVRRLLYVRAWTRGSGKKILVGRRPDRPFTSKIFALKISHSKNSST